MHAHSSKCISQLKKSEVIRGERDREMEKTLVRKLPDVVVEFRRNREPCTSVG